MAAGFLQLTPIPESHFENTNILDRMVKAIDGPDPHEVKQAWFNAEKDAYLEWSGVEDGDWRFTFVTGYPTKFAVFSGPWALEGEEPLPVTAEIKSYLDEIGTGAVYGDTGTSIGGVSFSSRARWKTKSKTTPLAEVGVTWRTLGIISLTVIVLVALFAWMVMNG